MVVRFITSAAGVDPQSAGVLVTATSTSLRQQIFAKQSKFAATRKKEVRGAMAVETQVIDKQYYLMTFYWFYPLSILMHIRDCG